MPNVYCTCTYTTWTQTAIGAVLSEHIFSYSYQLFEMASTDVKSEDSILLKESVIHVFKDVWTPRVGEILRIGKEAGNSHYRCIVLVLSEKRLEVWYKLF